MFLRVIRLLKKNLQIRNINKINLNSDDYLFHAGTIKKDDNIFAIGGRVLNFVSLSDNFIKQEKIFLNILMI